MGCTDEIGVQYTITCGGSSPVDVNTNCDSSSCSYERSTSSGCTLSVAVSDAVGTTASDTSIIQDREWHVHVHYYIIILKCTVVDHFYFSIV